MLLSIPFLKKINIFVYFILTILNLYVILNGIKGVEGKEFFSSMKEKYGKSSNIKGQTEEFSFDEQNLKIIKKIDKDILVIDEDDLDSTFPKTYSNLLIYTKDQECDVTYKE